MLKSIKLKNYCCHKDFTAEFQAGVNCIVGSNGSGKSSLVSALYGGLTNAYEHPEGMKGVIRQGSDKAQIVVEFDDFKVTREIGEKNKHTLVIDDETVRAAKDIENILASRFNIVKHVLDKFVFIRQGEFTNILSLSDADRAKTIAHLSNVEYFEVLWKKLADTIKIHEAVMSSGPTFDEQSITAQLEEMTTQLKEAECKVIGVTAEIALYNEQALQSALDYAQQLKTEQTLVDSYTAEIHKLVNSIPGAKQAQNYAEVEHKAITEKYAEIQLNQNEIAEVDAYKQYLMNYSLIVGMKQDLDNLEFQLKDWNRDEIQAINKQLTEQIQAIAERQAKHKLQLKIAEKIAEKAGEDCEVCGAAAEHQFKGNPIVLANTLNKLANDRLKLEQQLNTNISNISLNDNKTARIYELKQKLAATQVTNIGSNTQYYEDLSARYQQQIDLLPHVEQARRTLDAASRGLVDLEAREAEIQKLLENSRKIVAQAPIIEENARNARLALDTLQTLKINMAGLEADLKAKREHWASLNELLKQVKQKKNQKKLIKYVDLLNEVRSLVHRNNIPHNISRKLLQQLLLSINAYLLEFDAPFKVSLGENLEFRAAMKSGAAVDARALSGGQQCMLATSFWLSTFQTNASKFGLLCLDEPGDGLSVDNRKIFNEVLTKVDAVFRKAGQQALIVTHDESIIDLFYTIKV